jgi:hypothetical protein
MGTTGGWGIRGRQDPRVHDNLLAIFYVDDAYLASRDAGFLQHALDILVDLFERVGLQTNTSKTQTMICTPGRIQTQLPTESYQHMRRGRVTASEWNLRNVECRTCGKVLKASSLGRHLADVHDIYQQTVIAEELLETRPRATPHQRPRLPASGMRRRHAGWLGDVASLSGRASAGFGESP